MSSEYLKKIIDATGDKTAKARGKNSNFFKRGRFIYDDHILLRKQNDGSMSAFGVLNIYDAYIVPLQQIICKHRCK